MTVTHVADEQGYMIPVGKCRKGCAAMTVNVDDCPTHGHAVLNAAGVTA